MVKRHLKRLNAPKTWQLQRRGVTFVTRSNPGGMPKALTLPVSNVIKYDLKVAGNIKEVKHIINEGEVLVNGKKISDYKYPVCFTDIVSFPKMNAHYRLILESDGILRCMPISKEDAQFKIVKIIGKSLVKGKIQLNLMDGRNVFFEKQHYKVGDSLVLTVPEQIVKEHLKLEKGMLVLLYQGKHTGQIATLQDIKKDSVVVKAGDETYATKKDYVLVVGKDKPEIKLTR